MFRIVYSYFNKIILLLFFFSFQSVYADSIKSEVKSSVFLADSILNNIFKFSNYYSKIIDQYTADLYIKGNVKVNKKNHLIRYVPSMFSFDKKRKEYLIESFNELHYTSPNIYDRKLKAVSGTFNKNIGQITDMMDFFNINVYSSSLMSDKLLSPLDKESSRYYNYKLDSIFFVGNDKRYKIDINPCFQSTQLVRGYVVVSDKSWAVRDIYICGTYDLIKFEVKVDMGNPGEISELLPSRFEMNINFNFLGNRLSMDCKASLKYKSISLNDSINNDIIFRKKKYDLSDSYKLSCDTSELIVNREQFSNYRLIPLTKSDSLLYEMFDSSGTNLSQSIKKEHKFVDLWGQIGDVLIDSYDLNLYGIGSVRCSPLINPFMLSYSHSNGVSYKQQFKYSRLYSKGRLLRVKPQIGYNFTRKELYAKMDASYFYLPQKNGSFIFNIGNGNRIYSSIVLDKLKELPDSTFNFDKVDLDYFRNFHIDFYHSIELFNGFFVKAGLILDWRYLVNDSKVYLERPLTDSQWAKIRGIKTTYNTFAPKLTVSWTPCMYYYMNGNRKMNVGSKMPTFSMIYEKGFKGIFGSNTSHEKIELDIQHKIKFRGIKSFAYRMGGGFFTRQKDIYFVDFDNFSRNSLPEGWNDEIGGTFQLLDRRWYNSSRNYARLNCSYETPYLLLKPLKKISSAVQQERLYAGLLFMPHLNPYVELGYGIGTHIFDVGSFVSLINGKLDTFGFKFTFELFSR